MTRVGVTDGLVLIKWVVDRELGLLKSEVFNGDVLEMFDVWACLLFVLIFSWSGVW